MTYPIDPKFYVGLDGKPIPPVPPLQLAPPCPAWEDGQHLFERRPTTEEVRMHVGVPRPGSTGFNVLVNRGPEHDVKRCACGVTVKQVEPQSAATGAAEPPQR